MIEGVPVEQAIAVATYSNNTNGKRVVTRHCGGEWRFAPERELSDADAATIAKRVAIPGTLHIK